MASPQIPALYLAESLTGHEQSFGWFTNHSKKIHAPVYMKFWLKLETLLLKLAAFILTGDPSAAYHCQGALSLAVVCMVNNINSIGSFNTLRPRQNGRHFADDTFNCIFVNENVRISIKFSLKFVPKGPINNIPALVQIMAWRRPGDKPLSGPVVVSLLTHICITRPQWVNTLSSGAPFTNMD